ncbi:hypothetical protein BDW22DRAFT_171759 [Trametopsis cervina]|nr:hypothetical protein BDW22DRAFT_171759 [Trametopsis cervina]
MTRDKRCRTVAALSLLAIYTYRAYRARQFHRYVLRRAACNQGTSTVPATQRSVPRMIVAQSIAAPSLLEHTTRRLQRLLPVSSTSLCQENRIKRSKPQFVVRGLLFQRFRVLICAEKIGRESRTPPRAPVSTWLSTANNHNHNTSARVSDDFKCKVAAHIHYSKNEGNAQLSDGGANTHMQHPPPISTFGQNRRGRYCGCSHHQLCKTLSSRGARNELG